jgi:hypothetical protein
MEEQMTDHDSEIVANIRALPDEELLRMLDGNPANYRPFAWETAQHDLERRGGRNALSDKMNAEIAADEARKPNPCVMSSLNSLQTWAIINIGFWFFHWFLVSDFKIWIPNATLGFYLLAYGPAAIGVMMLLLALVARNTKESFAVLFNVFGLVLVGIWNILIKFWSPYVIPPAGFQVNTTDASWIVLGLVQVAWGAKWLVYYYKHKADLDKEAGAATASVVK